LGNQNTVHRPIAFTVEIGHNQRTVSVNFTCVAWAPICNLIRT